MHYSYHLKLNNMKKYKLLKTLFVSAPLLVTPLIAASCDTKANPGPIPTDYEVKVAIFNFAKEHGINKDDMDTNSIHFQRQDEKGLPNNINFSFKMWNNVPDSYFLNIYNGTLVYHGNPIKFTLQNWNQRTIPGYYQSSLENSSTIYGSSNDYILCLASGYFDTFCVGIENKDNIKLLFQESTLNPNKAKNFKLSDFTVINKNAYRGILPRYFAAFHVVNQKVVWTNLTTNKNILHTSSNDALSNVAFSNQANNKYTLFINNTVLRQLNEIYLQDKNFQKNPYLQPTYLKPHYTTKIDKQTGLPSQLGFQIASSPAYTNGNASLDDVVTCLLNLLKNDYSKLTEMLNKNYTAYYLTFNKISDVWTFGSYSQFNN